MPRNATSMMINVLIPITIQISKHNSGSVRAGADIPLTAVRSNSSFSKINNLGGCGRRAQQIMGGVWPQEIFG